MVCMMISAVISLEDPTDAVSSAVESRTRRAIPTHLITAVTENQSDRLKRSHRTDRRKATPRLNEFGVVGVQLKYCRYSAFQTAADSTKNSGPCQCSK